MFYFIDLTAGNTSETQRTVDTICTERKQLKHTGKHALHRVNMLLEGHEKSCLIMYLHRWKKCLIKKKFMSGMLIWSSMSVICEQVLLGLECGLLALSSVWCLSQRRGRRRVSVGVCWSSTQGSSIQALVRVGSTSASNDLKNPDLQKTTWPELLISGVSWENRSHVSVNTLC